MTLEEMFTTPGFFQVARQGYPAFCRVEVDKDLNVHQLTPRLERDGILSKDGWNRSETLEAVRLDVTMEHMQRTPGRYAFVMAGAMFMAECTIPPNGGRNLATALARIMVDNGFAIVYLPS